MMVEPIHVVIAAGLIGFIIVVLFLSLSWLWPVFRYAYLNARLSAMEARMFSLAKVREIAKQKSARSAMDALSATDYSKVNIASDSNNAELAFDQYFADHVVEVQKFSPKTTMALFDFYLREQEIKNLMYAMHIIINKIPVERDDSCDNFLNAGRLGRNVMKDIVFSSDLALAMDKLRDTEYYSVIDGYFKKYGGDNAGMLDAMLDRYNIMRLYDDATRGAMSGYRKRVFERKTNDFGMSRPDSFVIQNYARTRADMLNIIVALRLILAKAPMEEYREQFIPAGLFIGPEKREALFSVEKIENVGQIVSRTPYEEAFKDGLNEFLKTRKIDGIVKRFDEYLLDYVRMMARENPFSIAVLLRYMTLKRNEVVMLRSIVKGIDENVRFEIDDEQRIVGEN